MGSVKFDTYTKKKKIDDEFTYNEAGILQMLERYYSLSNSMTSIDIKIDLDRALSSDLLSGSQRITLAFIYAFELNMLQTSKLLSCSILQVKKNIDDSIELLEAIINGYKTKYIKTKTSVAKNLDSWKSEVMSGSINIYDIPANVNSDLLKLLEIEQNDILAAVKVNPKTDYKKAIGPANILDYPYHETSKAIEQPSGRAYNPISDGYDYFYKQDTNNNVKHFTTFDFPAELKKTGTRKGLIKSKDGIQGAKNIVYQ